MAGGFVVLGTQIAATLINRFLGGGLDEQAMAEVVNPDLYRNRGSQAHF